MYHRVDTFLAINDENIVIMSKKITIIKKCSAMSTQIILCQALTKGREHRTITYND